MLPNPSTYDRILRDAETGARRRLASIHREARARKKDFFVVRNSATLDFSITTLSGTKVNEDSALRFSAVFGAVKLLSEDVAKLPLFLYRRTERGKGVAREHPLFSTLHSLPNPEVTSSELRKIMMAHLLLWGNGYAEKQTNPATGRLEALWPIHPNRVTPTRPQERGPIVYEVMTPKGTVKLAREQMFHVRGLSLDGVTGLSPIQMHREAIGLGVAAAEFGARFFSQGLNAGGALEHPHALSDKAYNRLQESMKERYAGLSQAHRLMILEEGMKFNKLTIPPNDAQWIETRKFQVTEIARIYRLPPHKLGDLERATFSNIEEQNIEYVTDSLWPWLVCWEQAISRDLLSEEEREDLFAEFKIAALLRGKTLERFQAYQASRQGGWMSVNEIRALENQNSIGEQGDIYLSPLNMITADQAMQMAEQNPNVEITQGKDGWTFRKREPKPGNGLDHDHPFGEHYANP